MAIFPALQKLTHMRIGSWIHGFMDTWIHGSTHFRLPFQLLVSDSTRLCEWQLLGACAHASRYFLPELPPEWAYVCLCLCPFLCLCMWFK